MKAAVLVLLVLAATVADVSASRSRFVSLSHLRRVNERDSVPLLIAVRQQNLEELQASCDSVSSPSSSEYGQYWSLAEVTELVGNPDAVTTVVNWLNAHKASKVEVLRTNDFIRAELPAQMVEKALKIELHLFRNPHNKKVVLRSARPYTLPRALRHAVDHIAGVEPVDMNAPKTIRPISPIRSRDRPAPAVHKKRIGAAGAHVTLNEVTLVNVTLTTVQFEQDCATGKPSTDTWPCSSTSDAIASYAFVVHELKSDKLTTYTITKQNAASYQFARAGSGYYTFTVPQSAEQFGHYQWNLTSTGVLGDVSNAATYPGDEYGLGYQYFIVNYEEGTPAVFRQLYNVPPLATAVAGNSLAMAAFMGQTYSQDDLDKYIKEYKVQGVTQNVTQVGYNEPYGGDETMLDLEMEGGIAPNVPLFYVYTGKDSSSMDFILEWAANISTWEDAPLIHSISYGLPEYLYQSYFGIPIETYAARANAELQKICLRGYTVLVASGDGGSTDVGHGGESCSELAPMYPASSPWVTTVGATAIDTWGGVKSTGAPGEVVVSISDGQFWTSGGGFSQVTTQTMPSWQATAVAKYIASAPYLPKGANLTQRAFPDIAAVGDHIAVVVSGEDEDSGGTSASTPLLAGMLSHVNAARLAAGKPALGFVNPLLYTLYAEHPEVLYDVTIGDIACGDDECCPKSIGYPATKGWDATTGVGTIADLQLFTKVALDY